MSCRGGDRLILSQASVKYYKSRGVSGDARLFGVMNKRNLEIYVQLCVFSALKKGKNRERDDKAVAIHKCWLVILTTSTGERLELDAALCSFQNKHFQCHSQGSFPDGPYINYCGTRIPSSRVLP